MTVDITTMHPVLIAALNAARFNFEKDGYLVPCAMVLYNDGRMEVVGLDMTQKDLMMGTLALCSREAAAIAVINEAWSAKFATAEEVRAFNSSPDTVQVKDLPGAYESVTIMLHRPTEQRMICATITRDTEGKGTLGEWEDMDCTEFEGRMSNLFRQGRSGDN